MAHADRQRAALEAMAAVAVAAGCAPGSAPTTTQFKRYAKDLGLGWSVSKVGRAFRSWRNAQKAYEGGALPESARLVRQRESSAQAGRSLDDLLAMVARWMDEDPEGSTRTDYNKWRERRNDEAAPDAPRAPVWQQFTRALPELSVEDIRRAAAGDIADPVALGRHRAEERLARDPNPLGVAATVTVAALLEVPQTTLSHARRKGRSDVPMPVGYAGRDPVYLVEDALAYRDTGAARHRAGDELDGVLLTARGVAELCGVTVAVVDKAQARKRWEAVPPPNGRIAGADYWIREEVERWLGDKPK